MTEEADGWLEYDELEAVDDKAVVLERSLPLDDKDDPPL